MQEHVLQQVLGHSQPGHVCSLRDQPDGVQNVFVPQVAVRDCHGYTRGNPWAFKRAQEEPKRISNEGDMVQILF
jgi:hypothetical protein